MDTDQAQAARTAPDGAVDAPGTRAGGQFTTVGGALVTVVADEGGYEYSCGGCGAEGDSVGDRASAQAAANDHAWQCRAICIETGREPELVRALVVDVRQELHQLDTRAGAGMAICAAVLIGVVGRTPLAQPVYTFSVVGAALLTAALLLFFATLLPAPSSSGARTWRDPVSRPGHGQVRRQVSSCDEYMSLQLMDLQVAVRTKQRRFTFAMMGSGLALVTIACGAVIALMLGQ